MCRGQKKKIENRKEIEKEKAQANTSRNGEGVSREGSLALGGLVVSFRLPLLFLFLRFFPVVCFLSK